MNSDRSHSDRFRLPPALAAGAAEVLADEDQIERGFHAFHEADTYTGDLLWPWA